MICTLFTGQTSEEGIFMRYSYELKMECVELYRQGQWAKAPDDVNEKQFKNYIRTWYRIEEELGPDGLKHKNHSRFWSPEEKLELIAKVVAGNSMKEVACNAGINVGQLYHWIQKYDSMGYNGLINKRKKSKVPHMNKNETAVPALSESEREELIRLRAEIEYIKAENEVIKKEIALREEKAALLKAKKQQSSKNFEKKDIR